MPKGSSVKPHFSAQELAHAGGPLGRLIANEVGVENIRNMPKPKKWRKDKGVAGEANVGSQKSIALGPWKKTWWSVKDRISTRTGETIKAGQAHVYNSDVLTAVHEGRHLLNSVRKQEDAGHHAIEGAELFNARNRKEYEASKASHDHYLTNSKATTAAQEYELGARLMYDPSRGHFARQTVQASLESPADPKGTYIKYRNKQSYVGRGRKEPWELLRK